MKKEQIQQCEGRPKEVNKTRITINGVDYEPVDTQIIQGMDISCRGCDIFKAKIPRSPRGYPLCCEKGNTGARDSCYRLACRGIKRVWIKVKTNDNSRIH